MIMKTNLDKKEKYLLACSYGPDSMALFHMLVNEGIYFEVVHVNYHILDQADDDEKGIRDYCKLHNVKLHVLETKMPEGVNEEDWARTIRYDYFAEISSKTCIKNVLVAQHIDDFIETYFLQKERGFVNYFGIKEITEYKGAKIIRPFATRYTKNELFSYIEKNNIPYSIDPSNLVPLFKRNKIRIEVINNLTREEKENVLKEILEKNEVLQGFLKKLGVFIKNNSVNFDDFYSLFKEENDFYLLLIELLKSANVFHEISSREASEILKVCKSNTKNRVKKLNQEYSLYYEYGVLSIKKKTPYYEEKLYDFDSNKFFAINTKAKNFDLIKDSLPLIIKPVSKNETYIKDNKTFSVNRQFISWKVPISLRDRWPGIYDSKGVLLYVPKYESGENKSKGLLLFDLEKLQ